MSKRYILISGTVVLIFLVGLSFYFTQSTRNAIHTTSVSPSPTTLSILFPKGGERLIEGKQYTLKWKTGSEKTIHIFLINTGLASQGTSVSIIDRKYDVPNTGTYLYTLPRHIPTGQYTFEIGTSASQPFEIVPPTPAISFCAPSNLQTNIDLSPGAGNVYGTITIKNVSNTPCQIQGDQVIKVSYDNSVNNITVRYKGTPPSNTFSLQPQQVLYSQVHYPNGPQCNGQTKAAPVTLHYPISPTTTISFKTLNVQACSSPSDKTEITLWQLSTAPIVP